MPRIFPTLTANKLQATAYLLGVAFFSISFLVFLNASISFVVTDVIGQKHGVGDAVGTLGFADELLALVACPLWGLLSDRLGVRTVAVIGYVIIGISLICLVQAKNVYPELLLGRLGFSIGGAACSTMVTAILPAMTASRKSEATPRDISSDDQDINANITAQNQGNNRHSLALSVSSELTITPARYESSSGSPLRSSLGRRQVCAKSAKLGESTANSHSGTSQLAGFVGLFTGLGALLAVAVFLPLPARIGRNGIAQDEAVKVSFYIVGAIAIVVGISVLFGLRGLPGEENKGLRNLFNYQQASEPKEDGSARRQATDQEKPIPSYYYLVRSAVMLGFTDSDVALGYLGGFVARASSVGISLFIPLFVNAYFIREGLCTDDPSEDIKANCRRAYTLASMLTGVSQLVALICAPIFGWLNGQMSTRGILSSLPLAIGAIVGILGCIGFGMLRSPDPFSKDAEGRWAILAVMLLGISQIAAIVCSLGLLARGINGTSVRLSNTPGPASQRSETPRSVSGSVPVSEPAETAPLLPSQDEEPIIAMSSDRTHLKGTIAGVYSLAGGAGILLLTKLGGYLFDRKSTGAPFFMLAIFNAVLLAAISAIAAGQRLSRQKRDIDENAS